MAIYGKLIGNNSYNSTVVPNVSFEDICESAMSALSSVDSLLEFYDFMDLFGISNDNVFNEAEGDKSGVGEWIKNAIETIKKKVKEVINNFVNFIKNIVKKFEEKREELIQKFQTKTLDAFFKKYDFDIKVLEEAFNKDPDFFNNSDMEFYVPNWESRIHNILFNNYEAITETLEKHTKEAENKIKEFGKLKYPDEAKELYEEIEKIINHAEYDIKNHRNEISPISSKNQRDTKNYDKANNFFSREEIYFDIVSIEDFIIYKNKYNFSSYCDSIKEGVKLLYEKFDQEDYKINTNYSNDRIKSIKNRISYLEKYSSKYSSLDDNGTYHDQDSKVRIYELKSELLVLKLDLKTKALIKKCAYRDKMYIASTCIMQMVICKRLSESVLKNSFLYKQTKKIIDNI